MSQAAKSLASKVSHISSVPVSSLRSFPPKEAIFNAVTNSHTSFSPETWAKLQKPPTTAFSAFIHRIGLSSILKDMKEVEQACTHKSYVPFYSTHLPHEQPLRSNDNLSALGNSLLGLLGMEFLHASYPHLPTRVLKAALSQYVGPVPCANIAREMGAVPLVRWHQPEEVSGTQNRVELKDALATIPRSLTALVYHHRCLSTTRKFVHSYFLSREIDLRPLIKFKDPKYALFRTVQKYGKEKPVSRLLKETGRLSNSPIFIVGIYSGVDKLGEGFGSSLKMAEYRAAEDAMHRLYLTRVPQDMLSLPSTAFGSEGSVLDSLEVGEDYTPGEIGESEVIYASRSSL